MKWKNILNTVGIAVREEVRSIVVDSRQAKRNDLFIAINSGHDYIDDVLDIGGWVISEKPHPSDRVFLVDNSVVKLGEIAKEYRKTLNATVIGITGSMGKTSLTQFLAQVLPCVATSGNQNNEIGLPLTILKADKDTKYLVCEMGIMNKGDMDYIASILSPDIGIITHIAAVHLEQLKDLQGVFEEKYRLANYSKQMILNKDAIKWPVKESVTWFGKSADIKIKDNSVSVGDKVYHYDLKGVGYRIYTYACAHALFNILGLEPHFENINWPAMRMQTIKHSSGAEVIIDCYNANLLSCIAALQYIVTKPKYLIVLGEMAGFGETSSYYHEMLGRVLNKLRVDKVVMLGDHHKATMRTFLGEVEFFNSKDELKKWLDLQMQEGISVLIKGSRHLKMEELI